jgi:hypothetical protein
LFWRRVVDTTNGCSPARGCYPGSSRGTCGHNHLLARGMHLFGHMMSRTIGALRFGIIKAPARVRYPGAKYPSGPRQQGLGRLTYESNQLRFSSRSRLRFLERQCVRKKTLSIQHSKDSCQRTSVGSADQGLKLMPRTLPRANNGVTRRAYPND